VNGRHQCDEKILLYLAMSTIVYTLPVIYQAEVLIVVICECDDFSLTLILLFTLTFDLVRSATALGLTSDVGCQIPLFPGSWQVFFIRAPPPSHLLPCDLVKSTCFLSGLGQSATCTMILHQIRVAETRCQWPFTKIPF